MFDVLTSMVEDSLSLWLVSLCSIFFVIISNLGTSGVASSVVTNIL